jgi:hypothetical protein
MRQIWLIAMLAAVLLGGFLRLACLGAEFWLDEIWSYELAHAAGSPFGILFATRHDNNHHLNTLWLSFWPAGLWWGWYRLHAVLAGLASIMLAARVLRRAGRIEAILAAWLVASCSWLVLAGAEARGYALVICFALLALEALWSYLDTGSQRALGLFWLSAMLGFLSHLTFVHAYLGFVAWSLRRFARERRSSGDEVRRLLIVHAVPGVFFAGFYLASIRGMAVGGGPPTGTVEVLVRLLGLGLGGPSEGWGAVPFLVAAVLLVAGGLWLLWHRGQDVWVFFATTVVVSPTLFLALRRQEFLFERYLFVPFVFFLLLSAFVLGALVRQSRKTAVVAFLVLGVFLLGNAWTVVTFIKTGRGQFHEALAWVIDHDADRESILITGDHPFRVEKYVRFYAPYLAPDRNVMYLAHDTADWLFVHRLDHDSRPPPAEREFDAEDNVYKLVKAYPSRGVGAWGWFVYRRLAKEKVGDKQGRRHPDEAQVLDARQHQDEGQGVEGDVNGQSRQAKALRCPNQPDSDLDDRHQEQDQVERPAAVGRRQHADEKQDRHLPAPVPVAAVPPAIGGEPRQARDKGQELPAERAITHGQADKRPQGR